MKIIINIVANLSHLFYTSSQYLRIILIKESGHVFKMSVKQLLKMIYCSLCTSIFMVFVIAVSHGEEDQKFTLGKKVYEKNCNQCHELINPHELYPEEWAPLVRRHGVDANLTPKEQKLVIYYLKIASQS